MSDFDRDVRAPLFAAVERSFLAWLRDQYGPLRVRDCRDEHASWDFAIRFDELDYLVDVKCDRRMHETGRVPYEAGHEYPDGSWRDGWGRDDRLHYVAWVSPATGEGLMVYLPDLRAHVEDRLWHAEGAPVGWVPIRHWDNDRRRWTCGWAIPVEELRAAAVVREGWSFRVPLAVA